MKWAWRTLVIIGLVVALGIFRPGFSIYDYSWRCTKCLRTYHAVEWQFLGMTYWKNEQLQFKGDDLTGIFGDQCKHVYRTGGFGRESAGVIFDGITAEGNIFRFRWDTIEAAFALYKQFPNKELLRRTFRLTDSILPPDATKEYLKGPRSNRWDILFMLRLELQQSKTEQDWELAVNKAEAKVSSRL